MPIDCEHLNRRFDENDPVTAIDQVRNEVHLVCQDCGAAFTITSTRPIEEIQAEIEAAS
ncbi:hypothetical protein [Mycolicibacterium peregrinum]|uniref:hypothetical protein n=1 Tax=Mycolicibacterium peregrinum TaxID=43304 RepID=UPI003AAD126D